MADKRKEFALAPTPVLVNPELWGCLFRALTDEFPTDLLGLVARYRSPVWIKEWKHPPGMNRVTTIPHSEKESSDQQQDHDGRVGHAFLWGPDRVPTVTFHDVWENNQGHEPYHWSVAEGMTLQITGSCDRVSPAPTFAFRFGPAIPDDVDEALTSHTMQWALDASGWRFGSDLTCYGTFQLANGNCPNVLDPKTVYRWHAKDMSFQAYVFRAGRKKTPIIVSAGQGGMWESLYYQGNSSNSDVVRTGYMTNDGHHLACLLPGGRQLVVIDLARLTTRFFPSDEHHAEFHHHRFPMCVFNSYLYVLQPGTTALRVYDIDSQQLEGTIEWPFSDGDPTGVCVCAAGLVVVLEHREAQSFVS